MNTSLLLLAVWSSGPADVESAEAAASIRRTKPTVVVVVGAAGESEYGRNFSQWADRWQRAARSAAARVVVIGSKPLEPPVVVLDKADAADAADAADGVDRQDPQDRAGAPTIQLTSGIEKVSLHQDRDRLKDVLQNQVADAALWLVLMGHGTFDGRQAKFNLRGPDVSATELAEWLSNRERQTVVINCASASGPFLNRLAGPDRVVITATKSGHEHNYARFGDYLSRAITDPEADLDKDRQTSLLEAFLKASKRAHEFYASEGRLATEHALLDDNADGLGARAEWFRGIRPLRQPSSGQELDGHRAHQIHLVANPRERQMSPSQRRQRDELELAVAKLRDQKSELSVDAYYSELERLLVQLALLTIDD